MFSDLLSSLGQREILFLVVLSVTVLTIARYIFKDSNEFGSPAASNVSPGELKQIVAQVVEEKIVPLQKQIEELKERQSRQLPASDSRPSPSESASGASSGSSSGASSSNTAASSSVRNE